jgi:hypothetical protein
MARKLYVVLAVAAALVGTLAVGCGDDDDDDVSGPTRLVPPGDPDFTTLETPEQPAECASDDQCVDSCTHSCRLIPTGPTTCPIDPVPTPPRVADALCICSEGVCAWFADPP